jgi:hypothetical protein
MERERITLDLSSDAERLGGSLLAGGVFVQDCVFPLEAEVDLVVHIADRAIAIDAKVIFVDPNDHGVGLELVGFCPEMRQWIAGFISGEQAYEHAPEQSPQLVAAPPPDDGNDDPEIEVVIATEEPEQLDDRAPTHPDDAKLDSEIDGALDSMIAPPALGSEPGIPTPSDEQRRVFHGIHERLRRLTLADQIKMAHTGDVNERIILERLYGKTVWEALLRNPRLTGPEVSRIARMGALPRPLLEIILGNGGWLQIPEVRRALLACKRLGADHVIRVLRLLPKHELKLAAVQTVYPSMVRDTARRMLREVER